MKRLCKHCKMDVTDLAPIERAQHANKCPQRPTLKKKVNPDYPDCTVAGIGQLFSSSPLKAIRRRCLDCCAGSSNEVKFCPATECPSWIFRFGRPETAYRSGKAVTIERYEKMMKEEEGK